MELTIFKILSLVLEILRLRKELKKPTTEGLYWDLDPASLKLVTYRLRDPSGSSDTTSSRP